MRKPQKIVAFVILLSSIITASFIYLSAFSFSILKQDAVVKVYPGSTLNSVIDSLQSQGALRRSFALKLLSKAKGDVVKVGYYQFEKGISANALLNRLIGGLQSPIRITIPKFRKDFSVIAGRLSDRLLSDSAEILSAYHDTAFWEAQNIALENRQSFFIRNTYEVYWTITPKQLMSRMIQEFHAYFKQIDQFPEPLGNGLEVAILASIVDEETSKAFDRDTVAGLYLNRLRKGMRLEADPTVRFANGDFSVKRILRKDLRVESPYNTYKYAGLPKGPICNPSPETIQAVLANIRTPYVFMCASLENPGYHKFSRTLREHNNYSNRYRRSLNRRRIYR